MLSKTEFAELTDWSTVNEHSRDALIAHDREQRAEIERLKRELARMKAPPQTTEQSCPQCGPGARGDEDGCCAACGSTLCGAWVADLRDSARVRDARVEPPQLDTLVLVWSEFDGAGDWQPSQIIPGISAPGFEKTWFAELGPIEDFPFWLPMPPAPEVK